jgi:hypothetical protein
MLREIMTREKGRNEKKDFPGGGWGVLNAKKYKRLQYWNDWIFGMMVSPYMEGR